MVATEIRLDLNGKKGPDLWARLGESDTRQIVMHPGYYDPEGNWTPLIIDAENIFAKFRIVKPDNTFVIHDASLYLPSDPSIFVVTLPETATQVAGLGYYDLRIGDGETPDTFLYSAGGRFIIDDDMITDEMIASVASVNGLIFPDDFLTSADLSNYATKEYVDDAIAELDIPVNSYSESEEEWGKWLDNSTIYKKTIVFPRSDLTTGANVKAHNISNFRQLVDKQCLYVYTGGDCNTDIANPNTPTWFIQVRDVGYTELTIDIGSGVFPYIGYIYVTLFYIKN